MATKICSKCKQDKELSCFTRYKYNGDWKIRTNCKDCQKVMNKSWRERNRDHVKEYEKTYRKENHEEVLRRSSEWRDKNRDAISDYNKRKYWENPEDRRKKASDAYWADVENNRERARKYASRPENKTRSKIKERERAKKNPNHYRDIYQKHSEMYKESQARRRWLKEKASLNLSEEQIQQMRDTYWLARDLTTITGEPYEVDHIIPLRGKDICGLHVPWNLQVLPMDLNRSKNNKYNADEVLANPGVGI